MLPKKLVELLHSNVFNRFISPYKLLIVSTLFISLGVSAQQPTAEIATSNHEGWYQVEMIVFARKDDNGSEHWPSNIKLGYPGDWIELKDKATGADTKEPFYLLPSGERQLNTQVQKLQRSGRIEILFHNAWRQIITNKNRSKAIIINGGQIFGQHQALEGSIRLSVATYLKLQTNLWFSQFDLNVGQEITQQWPAIPLRPNYSAAPASKLSLDSDVNLDEALTDDNSQSESNSSITDDSAYVTRKIILLQQERDLRSGEVHYIDHPVLGVIVQITPYPPTAPALQ
ncbi:MAG TPA: CsiV family protein [Cellvibrio sp.]|nr:CsiV family protein [Cellvibrio sp.]